MPKDIVPIKSVNAVGDLETIISKVPNKDSMDWKLISGVLCNSMVEWVANDPKMRVHLIKHLQKDIGYLLQRLGLTM